MNKADVTEWRYEAFFLTNKAESQSDFLMGLVFFPTLIDLHRRRVPSVRALHPVHLVPVVRRSV